MKIAACLTGVATASFLLCGIGRAAQAEAEGATPHPIVVQVALSPKAQAKLRGMGEIVKVSAFYDGPPIASKAYLLRDEGTISLAPEESILLPPKGGIVTLKALISNRKWGWVTQHFYTVNVTSARKVDKFNNLLDCDLADGDLATPKSPARITCKLIYGE